MCDEDEGLVTRVKKRGWGMRRIRAQCVTGMREGLMCDQDENLVCDQHEGFLTRIKAQCLTRVRGQTGSRMRTQRVNRMRFYVQSLPLLQLRC